MCHKYHSLDRLNLYGALKRLKSGVSAPEYLGWAAAAPFPAEDATPLVRIERTGEGAGRSRRRRLVEELLVQ